MVADKQKPVIMLVGYFDESGITDDVDACAIAGFIGTVSALDRLRKNSQKVLDLYGVEYFHAFQFYAPREKSAKSSSNPYANWSMTKRKRFVKELLLAMKVPGVRLKSIGADAVAFRACSLEERKWLTGGLPSPKSTKGAWKHSGKPSSPYHMVFRAVVENCCESVGEGQKLHFTMSRQDIMKPNAISLYERMRESFPECKERLHDIISFASHKDYAQLQAADFVTYHLRKITSERRLSPPAAPQGIFKQILQLAQSSKDAELIDDSAIHELCQSLKNRHKSNELLREDAAKKARSNHFDSFS